MTKDNPFKLPKDLLYGVIVKTIKFDNLCKDIILTSFGLEPDYQENRVINLKEILRFEDFFMENIGATSKADILLEIIKDSIEFNKSKIKILKDFKGKVIKFYKIRNIFAHNLYPRRLDRKRQPNLKVPDWKELAKKHEELYKELSDFMYSTCYQEIDI